MNRDNWIWMPHAGHFDSVQASRLPARAEAVKAAAVFVALSSCCLPYSFNGRWRGDVADSDLIGICRQLRVCERSGLTTRGAGAESWDRCSLRCGCDPDTVNDGRLFWSDPVCQP